MTRSGADGESFGTVDREFEEGLDDVTDSDDDEMVRRDAQDTLAL